MTSASTASIDVRPVHGFGDLASYLRGHPHFGATVGRVANRIAKARFTLDGRTYELAVNNGKKRRSGGWPMLP